MTRIAFVAPHAWHAISGQPGYVGGAEMQQVRLARVLAARGHDVAMIVADFGQPPRVTIDGIRVERSYAPYAGLPGLRYFHPRWSGIVAALDRVQPDVVYQRTAGPLTGQCALWAKARGRRFVYACAHDWDTLARTPVLPHAHHWYLYLWGLRHADRVLAQSEFQAAALERNHGIKAAVVHNVIPLPPAPRPFEEGRDIVWLGTVKADKRPAWLLAAARALPERRFVLAGGPPPPPTPDDEMRAIRKAAAGLSNVELTGALAPPAVTDLLQRAAVMGHTSPAEGFPNTLLEAWALGIPSVSVVDPDGAVSGGAGVRVDDEASFIEALRSLMASPERRRALGDCARKWVSARHSPDVVARAFEAAVLPEGKR